jgi:hypothetical protein
MLAAPVSEEEILQAVRQLPSQHWGEVLAFAIKLRTQGVSETTSKQWTAAELLTLPLAQRDAILAQQADRAAADYASDPELTAFDAYGEHDLYVDSSDTQTR